MGHHFLRCALLLASALATVCICIPQQRPADEYFPQFHVRPPSNWINDPNGPFRSTATGLVHLWMQYNPFQPVWGNMSWWHAVSEDYVTWKDVGVSLTNNDTYDINGVFSGSVTVDPVTEIPTIVYTCVDANGAELQCAASPQDPSDPLLRLWVKSPFNPIVSKPFPGENGVGNFRDPTTAWLSGGDASDFEIAFGGSRKSSSASLEAVAVVYKGPIKERLLSSLNFSRFIFNYSGSLSSMFECPDLFPIFPATSSQVVPAPGTLYVLKDSNEYLSKDYYRMGYLQSQSFTSSMGADYIAHSVDYGVWYASKTFWDDLLKERIIWGWIKEEDTAFAARGWAGAQSVPRYVRYNAQQQQLEMYPIDAIESLRLKVLARASNVTVPSETCLTILASDGGNPGPLALQQDIDVTLQFPRDSFILPANVSDPRPAVSVRFREGPKSYAEVRVTYLDEAGVTKNNTDSPGGDYYDFPSPSRTNETLNVANCSKACEMDSRCIAWTYVRPPYPAPLPPFNYAPRCSLKASAPEFWALAACCVSGRVPLPVLGLHRSQSGTTGPTNAIVGRVKLLPQTQEDMETVSLSLRILIDHSIVEIFANHGLERLSARLYIPLPANSSSGVSVWSSNMGAAKDTIGTRSSLVVVQNVSVWSMMSIWL
jgi:sucrose-6-phosphate hydrolase SacC (GH32 family)